MSSITNVAQKEIDEEKRSTEKCLQHVMIFWNPARLLAFTFNEFDECVANTANDGYTGQAKTSIILAMSSIFHYPSVWTIRPESY